MFNPTFAITLLLASTFARATTETPKPVDAFVDSFGVNTHYINSAFPTNAYANPALAQKLADLGIRHLRDNTAEDTTNPAGFPKLDSLYTTFGIRTTLVLGSTLNTPATLVNILKAHPAYEAIEGLNEPDANTRSYNGFTDDPATNSYPATKAYQNDIYTAVKSDPQTAARTVVSPAMGNPAKSQFLLGSSFEYEALHSYPNARNPTFRLDTRIASVNQMSSPSKPIWATETGYYNKTADGGQVSELAAGKYMPRLFAEFFNRGVQRTFDYELVDENPTTDRESNFGLLRYDLTEKPAYTALENLIDLVQDPNGPAFTPKPLNYTLTAPTTVDHTLLQKSDGTYYLALWNEVLSWDLSTATDINNAPVSATLALPGQFHATIFQPNLGPNPIATFDESATHNLNLSVPDQMLIIQLTPVPEPMTLALLLLTPTLINRRRDLA